MREDFSHICLDISEGLAASRYQTNKVLCWYMYLMPVSIRKACVVIESNIDG